MLWDGSYLGAIPPSNIRPDPEVGPVNLKTWVIYFNGVEEKCFVKSCGSKIPSFLDEFKPIFGLCKTGCHTFKCKSLMICFPYAELTPIDKTSQVDKIRKLLAFRELFGVIVTQDKHLCERNNEIISLVEANSIVVGTNHLDLTRRVMTKAMYDKWFNGVSLNQTISDLLMLPFGDADGLLGCYRYELEKIITRIDKDSIGCVDLFVDRIASYLC